MNTEAVQLLYMGKCDHSFCTGNTEGGECEVCTCGNMVGRKCEV